MKAWIIVAVLSLVLITGIVAVKALTSNDNSNIGTKQKTCNAGTCPYISGGGCTATKNCDSSTCRVITGKTCGCGK